MLRQYRVSACPVINDAGKVVGVVSEADLLYKVADPDPPSGLIRLRWKLGEESKVNAITAGQLMTSPAISIQPDAPVAIAARVMQDRRVRRLPVVGPDGMLIGIVSRTDLLSVYERPDRDIRDEVTQGNHRRGVRAGPGRVRGDASRPVSSPWQVRWHGWRPPWRCWRASATPRAWSRSATGSWWRRPTGHLLGA